MYACMYVMYACMYVCMHACIYIYMYVILLEYTRPVLRHPALVPGAQKGRVLIQVVQINRSCLSQAHLSSGCDPPLLVDDW